MSAYQKDKKGTLTLKDETIYPRLSARLRWVQPFRAQSRFSESFAHQLRLILSIQVDEFRPGFDASVSRK